jgi:hypothetical protein
MSDNRDQKLEEMLRSRRMEPASADLAQRIILKAQGIPQIQTVSPVEWVKSLFAEFHLPKPAYVLAGALLIGLGVGLSAPRDTSLADADNAPLQSFLYADEDVL